MKQWISVAFVTVTLACGVGCAGHATAIAGVSTTPSDEADQEPPAPQPDRPKVERNGYFWVGGRWEWRANQWSWLSGHWEKERDGEHWEAGRWEHRDGKWHWIEGHFTKA